MGVNSLPKTATRQRRGCDLNPGRTAPESSTLTTQLPSHPCRGIACKNFVFPVSAVRKYQRKRGQVVDFCSLSVTVK